MYFMYLVFTYIEVLKDTSLVFDTLVVGPFLCLIKVLGSSAEYGGRSVIEGVYPLVVGLKVVVSKNLIKT